MTPEHLFNHFGEKLTMKLKCKPTYWLKRALLLVALVVATSVIGGLPVTQAQVGGQIGYGTSMSGTLSSAVPSVTYSFNGAAGDLVQIEVKGVTGGLDPMVELIGPDQQPLASSQHNRLNATSQDALLARFLPQTGAYSVRVSGVGGTVGDYVLRLHGRGIVTRTPLVFDQAVPVDVPQNAAPQYFTFTAGDCPTTLTIDNVSAGNPFTFPFVVLVRNPLGQVMAQLKGGDAQRDHVTVPASSGQYEVEVLADDPLLAGAISLLVSCAADAPGCPGGGDVPAGDASAGADCPDCPPCPTGGPSGDEPTCPDMEFTTVPAGAGVFLTWAVVPEADHYLIHIYGYHGDDEVYLGAAGAPGAATEFHLDHLFEGFWSFRFVIEARLADNTVICTDETEFFTQRVDVPQCENFTATGVIEDHEARVVTWSWSEYPAAEFYGVLIAYVLPDRIGVLVDRLVQPAGTSSFTYHIPPADGTSDTWWAHILAIAGDELLCDGIAEITFEENIDQVEWQECANFTVWLIEQTASSASVGWSAYPAAEQYWFYVLDAGGDLLPGFPVMLPTSQTTGMVDLMPGTYTIGVAPYVTPEGAICEQEVQVTISDVPSQQFTAPCEIRADRADVWVHVGPGRNRNVFTFLEAERNYLVTGQAVDDDDNLWWQIDKTQVPGHEAVISLWVAASDVTEIGNCTDIAEAEQPPIIPDDGGGDVPGVWLPCGSCNTCGHPANECVTAPDGSCLWDPTTCAQQPEPQPDPQEPDPQPDPQEPDPPPPTCYTLSVSSSSGGSANIVTPQNCPGGYTPGSLAVIQASPSSGYYVQAWSGSCDGLSLPGYDLYTQIPIMNASCSVYVEFQQAPY